LPAVRCSASTWAVGQLAGEEVVEIDAAPEVVWAYRLDFTSLPEYNPDVSGVTRVIDGTGAGGPAGAGARYEFSLATPVGAHAVSLTVTGVVADREVSAQMKGAMGAHETFGVEPIGAGRCRATLRLWLDLPPDLPAAQVGPVLENGRAQIRAELDGMQAILEARPAH
jgi:hypothetical protein